MTEAQTVDLASWLTAVWDEDEAMATGMLRAEIGGFPSPRQTLARIAADRKILNEHAIADASDPEFLFCRVCHDYWRYDGGVYWPCPTVRALVSPYKDYEGFQEAWL